MANIGTVSNMTEAFYAIKFLSRLLGIPEHYFGTDVYAEGGIVGASINRWITYDMERHGREAHSDMTIVGALLAWQSMRRTHRKITRPKRAKVLSDATVSHVERQLFWAPP